VKNLQTGVALTDRQLIEQFQNGDERAFGVLFNRHRSRLLLTIRQIIKDEAAAEDLLQDASIRMLEKLRTRSYAESDRFGPWAARIVRNMAIDAYRRNQRSAEVPAPEQTYVLEQQYRTWETPEQNWCRSEDCHYVVQWIEQLPPAQREVLMLRHYDQLTFREIAEKTNVSINTALGRMRYALINLRKMADQSVWSA